MAWRRVVDDPPPWKKDVLVFDGRDTAIRHLILRDWKPLVGPAVSMELSWYPGGCPANPDDLWDEIPRPLHRRSP